MDETRSTSAPKIDSARLDRRIASLAAITDVAMPWSRTAFSDLHLKGREWLAQEMGALGLQTTIDAGGNLIGRCPGARPELGHLASGSHSDTVPAGGRYDGAAGVLIALEAFNAIRDAGTVLSHTFEVIDFLAEEPNQYGMSCIGSRAMVGALTSGDLGRKAPDGTTLAEGIARMGGDPSLLDRALRAPGELAAFVELHIEQGRVLEAGELDIGIVTDIVGIRRMEVSVLGRADHSGATPMSLRSDALVGAAEMIQGFERRALGEMGEPLVATVGKLNVSPNAANVVPGQVDFTLEVRGSGEAAIQSYLADVNGLIQLIADRRKLSVTATAAGVNAPVKMSGVVRSAISRTARKLGLKAQEMPSGAGHDAAFVARLCPAGMVFVPSRDGRSHCPEEFTSSAELAAGAQVLLDTILSLDASLSQGTEELRKSK